jgi:hypothetical protein
MFRKSLAVVLAFSSLASAVTITDFGFVSGKVSSPDLIHLVYEDLKATNPVVPLVFSPVSVDTSGWLVNGDPVSASSLSISGFDLPTQKIVVDLDCTRHEFSLGPIPSAVTHCEITGIAHIDSPTVFGSPIDLASTDIVLTEQGTDIDVGMLDVKFNATASGTGTAVMVTEQHGNVIMMCGGGFLLLVGLLRMPTIMRS